MYSESELRDMLRASADRVPAAEATSGAEAMSVAERHDLAQVDVETLVPHAPDRLVRRNRRFAAPLAVAAATVVLAGVVTVLVNQGSDSPDRPAAAGDRTSADATVSASTATTSAPPAPRLHQALTPLIDVVTIKPAPNSSNYVFPEGTDKHGEQVVHKQLPGDHTINLDIVPAKSFDDVNVSKSHPVAIAGTTGYYDVLRLYPFSKNGKGGSAPTGVVVFRTPDGYWVFATLKAGTKNDTVEGTPVNDSSKIKKGFDRLGVTFAAGTFRTPLKLNYLPAGARFSSADESFDSKSRIEFPGLSTSNDSGVKQLNVYLTRDSSGWVDGTTCQIKAIGCTARYHRTLANGWTVVVDGIQYSAAETKKVADNVQLASDLAKRSSYFTLADAVG